MERRIRNRRALRPQVEGMEARALLTVMAAHHQVPVPPDITTLMTRAAQTANGFDSVPNSETAPLLGNGRPSPHESARQDFRAIFTGAVSFRPGRFSDQKQIMFLRGTGGSTQFLHGYIQMGIATPNDPQAPLTGVAMLSDKNVNAGGYLGLDLTADRQSVDRFGRPTHMTFTSDPNIYSGIYFSDAAIGTADIHYRGGIATIVFKGNVYTSGLTTQIPPSPIIGQPVVPIAGLPPTRPGRP